MSELFPGKFITFEGLDGSGKSTQLRMLAAWLRDRGIEVVETREPGGTGLGERLRPLLLHSGPDAPNPVAELALLTASRAQNVEQTILPALRRGAFVLCDRFHDATEAYQAGGRGLPVSSVHELHRLLCHDLQPHRTLILSLDIAASVERARKRLQAASSHEGRFEQEDDAFFSRVAAAYASIAKREPSRCRLIAATGLPDAIAQEVRAGIAGLHPKIET